MICAGYAQSLKGIREAVQVTILIATEKTQNLSDKETPTLCLEDGKVSIGRDGRYRLVGR